MEVFGNEEGDVYYAPTCGFKTWKCPCGNVIDLEEYTGISEAEASNADLISAIIDSFAEKGGGKL